VFRLVVVLPLEPLQPGDGFPLREWPLHVTVAPTFVVQTALSHVVAAIEPVLADRPGLSAVAGEPEGFGPSQTIPVTVVEPNADLTALHLRLVDALRQVDAVFDDPQYVGPGYRAHVTATRLAAAAPGQRLWMDQAAIVDMAPYGERRLRRVVWVTALCRAG
jgi:hypothetical protein